MVLTYSSNLGPVGGALYLTKAAIISEVSENIDGIDITKTKVHFGHDQINNPLVHVHFDQGTVVSVEDIPTLDTSVANKLYVDTQIGNLSSDAGTSLSAAIAAEQSRAQAAEQAIATDLSTELSRAQAAEQAIASDLSTEQSRAQAAEQAIATDLSTELSRAQAAEQAIATDLSTELSRAQAAEQAIAADLSTEQSRAQAAEQAIAADLSTEQSRAQAAEQAITTDLTTETSRATGVEANLSRALNELFLQFFNTTLQSYLDNNPIP